MKRSLKFYLILWSIIFLAVISIFSGGSIIIDMYAPSTQDSTDVPKITYNKDTLAQITSGYEGEPKLVKSDDKVFYIPPEYCEGHFLMNFRIIGINNSCATEVKDAKGDITDYTGAVVLYGFQTTYKEDYGADYDFDFEPYDYNVEYEIVDSYFESPFVNSTVKKENNTLSEEDTENTSEFSLSSGSAEFTENKNAVDDSDFRVATLVMEHVIGRDECTILYCDPDSAKVSDLGAGKYNLVTNLNDSALTVCYNDKLFVYGFDEQGKTYANNERYYYKIQDLFDSITYLNIMANLGYADVSYNLSGRIEVSSSSEGWANVWTSKMEKSKSFDYDGTDDIYKYMSNINGDIISEQAIKSYFGVDLPGFANESMKNAYKKYKKTTSGWLSYKENSNINNGDDDYVFVSKANDGNKTWSLKKDISLYLEETSLIVFVPKTYKETVDASLYLDITPEYSLKKEYDYTITDLLLTKYEMGDSNNHYSIIMQMMITPKESSSETEEMEPIEDFEKYAAEIGKNRGTVTAFGRNEVSKLPSIEEEDESAEEEDIDEDDIEEEDIDETELEEELAKQIGGSYVTFNIKLDQVQGVVDVSDQEDFQIKTITGGNELNSYFDELKEKYKQEYSDNIKSLNAEKKSGALIPKEFNTSDMEDFKVSFEEIKNICTEIEDINNEIATLENRDGEIAEAINSIQNEVKGIGYNTEEISKIIEEANKFKAINVKRFLLYYYIYFKSGEEYNNIQMFFDEKGTIDEVKYKNYKGIFEGLLNRLPSTGLFISSLRSNINICLNYLEYKYYIEGLDIEGKIKSIEDYRTKSEDIQMQIEELNEKIAQLNTQLNGLKDDFDDKLNDKYSINFKWNNEVLNGDGLVKYYKEYDDIISKVNDYEEEYNKFLPDTIYSKSADSFIDEAKALNCDEKLRSIFEIINFALPEENGKQLFGEQYNSYLFLSNNLGEYYANAENVKNAFKILVKADDAVEKEEIPKDTNEIIVNEYIKKKFSNISDNLLAKKSYSTFLNDCQEIYDAIMAKFENIYDEDGNLKQITTDNICDITLDDVKINAEAYLCNERGILELSEYSEEGQVIGTYTLSNGCLPYTSSIIEEESATESTTEGVYKNSNELINVSFDGLNDYTEKIKNGFTDMRGIADLYLSKEGPASNSGKNTGDIDVTSDYYIYTCGVEYGNELSRYLDEAHKYYVSLKEFEKNINELSVGKLNIVRKDDVYYKWLCSEKIIQVNELYKLIISAKTAGAANTEKYVREYSDRQWLIEDDVKLTNDFSINVSVSVKKIKTLYQDVKWNTALVKEGDVTSNITEEPYEFYQMNSNYCIAAASNEAFLVPIGVQIYDTVSARAINRKISEELEKLGVGDIKNVAYGSITDYKGAKDKYDIILFSSSDKWYSIYLKQGELDESGKPTYDTNNVYGEKGTFSLEENIGSNKSLDADSINSADAHFLEYDHTQITGSAQFYSTTTENGYFPYKIDLYNKVIVPDEGAGAIEGSFYNSWAASNGFVVLLGYTEDDLYLEENDESEGKEDRNTDVEEETEETTEERQKREVNDLDIYNAHLYVLKYQVKEPEVPFDPELINADLGSGGISDEFVQLEGTFGELATPAVNFFIILKYSVFAVVYAIAIVYCIYLGVRYSKAGDYEEKKKAKEHIKWFIIAFIGTHILIVFISLAARQLSAWSENVTVVTTEVQE